MASRSLGPRTFGPLTLSGSSLRTSSTSGNKALVGSVGEQKWIIVWIKASDKGESYLWRRLLGFHV